MGDSLVELKEAEMKTNEAINLLDNLIGMVEDSNEADYDTALKMGIEAMKWIPISEEKPLEQQRVLVTRRYGKNYYVETGEFWGETWCGDMDEYKIHAEKHSEPIAWMPLPKPYRADKEQ